MYKHLCFSRYQEMEQTIFNMTPLTSCMFTIKTELMCNDSHIKQ